MLIGVVGDVGSGKTVFAVRCIKKDFGNGRKIFSNTPLKNIPFTDFDIDNFLSNDDKYRKELVNATILLDEITVYMDCRLSNSKQNLMMGYLVLQSRKRGLDIYYTTQDLDLVDFKRLVKYTKIIVFCNEIFVKDKKGMNSSLEHWRKYTLIDMRKRNENITHFNMNIQPYYKFYDTDFIIEPLVKLNKEVKNERKKV